MKICVVLTVMFMDEAGLFMLAFGLAPRHEWMLSIDMHIVNKKTFTVFIVLRFS